MLDLGRRTRMKPPRTRRQAAPVSVLAPGTCHRILGPERLAALSLDMMETGGSIEEHPSRLCVRERYGVLDGTSSGSHYHHDVDRVTREQIQ